MSNLLEISKVQLTTPLGNARRKLLILLNILYVVLVIVFLTSEKIATGNFVPDPILYFVYIPTFLINLFSVFFNIQAYKAEKNYALVPIPKKIKKIDGLIGWVSFIPIMIMSFCHLTGLGNPCNDAILTDYALANSLIIGAVIVIGRKGATVWFLIVLAVLFWDVTRLGWDYEFHYSTPSEVVKYKEALKNNESWALQRKAELEKHHLNPPKVTRYFNTWIVFIIIAFAAAYFFSGITLDILKVVPSVIDNIEQAIEANRLKDIEIEQKQREITKSAMRIARYNELLEDLNKEIESLDYKDKRNLAGVINKIRKAWNKETDWESFETKFDSVHGEFFKTLQNKFPNLSRTEMNHLAYIRMNLSTSEIASLMAVTKESLRSLRYRLKKKLNLTEDIDLRDFACNVEVFD